MYFYRSDYSLTILSQISMGKKKKNPSTSSGIADYRVTFVGKGFIWPSQLFPPKIEFNCRKIYLMGLTVHYSTLHYSILFMHTGRYGDSIFFIYI